jgi:hypothetical protein
MLPMVAKNAEFKELHSYYTKRANNPLAKKQSIIVLCCKLIRVAFAIMTRGIDYSGEKLMSDIQHSETKAA